MRSIFWRGDDLRRLKKVKGVSCSYGSWNDIGVIWRHRNVAEMIKQKTLIMDVLSILKSELVRLL